MSGLEALAAMIYHEPQQKDSMLCAQHALNSLLQGNYFTAPDLGAIAQSFDALEQGALDESERSTASTNMDDTGFFSVQVIEKALEVWGLNLVRWRSEQMRPFQASPHTQLAFVLNLHQHWFTLRRFGPATTDPATDPGRGHWFNLNSSYNAPKWVSRTYLNMFLQQCETEGYSVFAVVQADSSKPLALPRTEADALAATVDAPDSMLDPSVASGSSSPGAILGQHEDVEIPEDKEYTLDEEDLELQAALQASITGNEYEYGQEPHVPRLPVPAPALRPAPPPPILEDSGNDDSEDTSDPIAASLARQRATLEHMRRMQEAALRETYEDEASNFGRPTQRRRTEQEEEAEQIRLAIAASMGEHGGPSANTGDDDDDPEWRPEDDSDARIHRGPPIRAAPPTAPARIGNRVYDDEDAELQAALRASLESAPQGYVHPPTPSPPRPTLSTPSVPVPNPAPPHTLSSPQEQDAMEVEDKGEEEEEEEEEESERLTSPPPVEQKLDVDEIRRRRLARFGG